MVQTLFANIPAILCLLVGYALVIFEMCLPGFGIPGILGIVLLLVGILTGTTSFASALILSGVMIALVLIALPICLRFIGKGRFSKSRLILKDVSVLGKKSEQEKTLNKYEGAEGVAITALRPSGVGLFDGERLDVVSSGEFIDEGAKLRVEHVAGNRVVVKEIEL